MYETELNIAKQAAHQAGQFLKPEFLNWNGKTQYKAKQETFTCCDKKSEQIIIKLLKKHFPSYTILSEEKGLIEKHSDYFWTVDPIDGTNNFIRHNPNFTVSISLLYKNEIVLGVTYVPMLDEMYWAVKNQGAYKNDKKIRVAKTKKLSKAIVTYNHGRGLASTKKSFKVFEYFQSNAYRARNYFSTSLQMAMVAAGHLDVYLVPTAKLWDIAAGIILLQEAGAQVTDWQNKPWQKSSTSLLASNNTLHNTMLEKLKKLKLA